MKLTKTQAGSRYFTWEHNIEGCLQNGSYVVERSDGTIYQYMNGDCMGDIEVVPAGMTMVEAHFAVGLLPKVCR